MKYPFLQKNLDVFKATFQKPSQIYIFLSETSKSNPFYLHRNLSYIRKHRNASKNKKICYYDWICNDPAKTHQKTKSYGFICPWCDRDYKLVECLMTHLKCCHSRFNFNLVEENGQTVIETTLNPSFDGSYCGFKYPGHNLRRDFRFTPSFPERRASTNSIIHCRPKKKMKSSSHQDAPKGDVDVCSGRLYYHTTTCLPVKPNELDIDSEADMEPDWLKERTQLMIDEFTDVNEGEKVILKMWNLHMMKKQKYKSDTMMRQACIDFVKSQGHVIISENLYKNFALHLANLFDFGLLASNDVLDCMRLLSYLNGLTTH